MRRWIKWVLYSICAIIIVVIVLFLLSKQFTNVSENNLPKFIKANVVDAALVTSVSKFRSGAGHSNPGWPETCRSMKHYITVFDPSKKVMQNFDRNSAPPSDYAVDIYSPVDGRLSKSGTGEGDDQLNIGVDNERGFSIRLEHVHLNPGMSSVNTKVRAGQKIATVWNNQNFDLSVYYHYYKGDELFSYFEVLPDNLFAAWQTQGATNPNEFIFTKEYRDAHPLTCLNDRTGTPSFAGPDGKPTENWTAENIVYLPNFYKTTQNAQQQEINNINSFDECAKHFPVIQTFPEQCKTDTGITFIKE